LRERILVVDDDELVRMSLEGLLRAAGYVVSIAPSAATALDSIRQERPDLILLDLTMPGLSGWDFLGRLREARLLTGVPIVAHTGEDVDPERLRREGFTGYLPKTARLEQILCTVRTALDSTTSPVPVWLHSCDGKRCIVVPR
jgi:CheY-like chemotaxis protein